ncbi:MAG: DUF892 family protein [Terracidiphilus sp.]
MPSSMNARCSTSRNTNHRERDLQRQGARAKRGEAGFLAAPAERVSLNLHPNEWEAYEARHRQFRGNVMKLLIEKLPDLQALYVKQLRLLLSAEEMSAIKLAFLVDSSSDSELHESIREHLQETEVQASRLRDILKDVTDDGSPLKCGVLYALFDEAEDMIQGAAHPEVCDAMVITGAQRIEHYEIAAYGSLRQFARVLGRDRDAQLLDQTLQEEGNADHRLTKIADRINPTARKAA